MEIEQLTGGKFYHIYNRGNNGMDVFFEKGNYTYFLELYDKYVSPVADTFSWCLMKNHFHFLVYLKLEEQIKKEEISFSTSRIVKEINTSRQFSHFFNAYTQAINKKYGRGGSIFEKPFKRKNIQSEDYLRKLVFYIHNNPVHHGVCENMKDYPWSSFQSIVSGKQTKLKRTAVIEWFDSLDNLIHCHENPGTFRDFEPF